MFDSAHTQNFTNGNAFHFVFHTIGLSDHFVGVVSFFGAEISTKKNAKFVYEIARLHAPGKKTPMMLFTS